MSTPKGHKELWKNCTWKDAEEKLAFFNHYFKSSHMVTDRIENEMKRFKEDIIEFIKEDKIKDKDGKERIITIKDILERIQEKG